MKAVFVMCIGENRLICMQDGNTVLHVACLNDNIKVAVQLAVNGASINVSNKVT